MNKQTTYTRYTKKTYILFYMFLIIVSFLLIQLMYLSSQKSMSNEALEKKLSFVSLVGLPDLSLSSESYYIRHRTLSSVFSIYPDDGALREKSNASFVISPSYIINKNKNKNKNEK